MKNVRLACLVVTFLALMLFIVLGVPGTGELLSGPDEGLCACESEAYYRGEAPGFYRDTRSPAASAEAAAVDEAEEETEEGEQEGEQEDDSPVKKKETIASVYPLPASSLYTYEQMTSRLHSLRDEHPDLIKVGSVGASVEGRDLWSLSLGTGERKILLVGGCHAREWLTSALLIRTIEAFAGAYSRGGAVDGYPVRQVLDQYTLVFVPMQNPDGVVLAQYGLAAFPEERHAGLLSMKPGKTDNFTRWKSNIRGVDLNRQYSAGSNGWASFRNSARTPRKPWYEEYPGPSRESEPESRALGDLIRWGGYEAVLNYHSTGNIFYWYYYQSGAHRERDLKLLGPMSAYSGYKIDKEYVTPGFSSHLTAWVVHDLKIPCITVEIGEFSTGYLNMGDLQRIWPRTRALPLIAAKHLPSYRSHCNLICLVNPQGAGQVTGGGRHDFGTTVKISAKPGEHYAFVSWTENGVSIGTDMDMLLKLTADRNLTANFKPAEYSVSVEVEPADGGEVMGSGAYAYGTGLTLQAIPHEGYVFDCWMENGSRVGDNAEYTFTVQGNRSLKACFAIVPEGDENGDENGAENGGEDEGQEGT